MVRGLRKRGRGGERVEVGFREGGGGGPSRRASAGTSVTATATATAPLVFSVLAMLAVRAYLPSTSPAADVAVGLGLWEYVLLPAVWRGNASMVAGA